MRWLVLSALVLPLSSFAAPKDKGVARVVEIDFETLELIASVQRPSGTFVHERARLVFDPFTRLRENFDPEIKQSVDIVK